MLRHLNWNEGVRRSLNDFLRTAPAGAAAVFDWDNTCIAGDIGDAVFRHQLFRRQLRLSPAQLAALLPDEVDGRRSLPVCGRDTELAALKERIAAAYARGAAAEFAVPLLALTAALESRPGTGTALAYAANAACLHGFSDAQVRAMTRAVAAAQLAAPLRWRSRVTADGAFRCRWREGIRLHPEMRQLLAAMRRRGLQVVICTATHTQVVAAMARLCRFNHDLLIGMEPPPPGGGAAPPANWGAGKTANLRARLGGEPLFVAGDSPGDIPMLTAFAATRLRLLIDRGALDDFIAQTSARPGYLVQRSDGSGRFVAG